MSQRDAKIVIKTQKQPKMRCKTQNDYKETQNYHKGTKHQRDEKWPQLDTNQPQRQ